MFEKIKKWYDEGRYTKKQVANLVKKGILTAIEYGLITGEEYEG